MADDDTTHEAAAAVARLRAWFQDTSKSMVMDEADFDDVEKVLNDYEQLRATIAAADDPNPYRRWLTRNLGAAYAAGWEAHADLVSGTLATLASDKREQCGRAWVAERLADLTEDNEPTEQHEDGARAKFAADMNHLRKRDPGGAQFVEHIVALRTEQHEDGDRG